VSEIRRDFVSRGQDFVRYCNLFGLAYRVPCQCL
jgi:hypothetical protein